MTTPGRDVPSSQEVNRFHTRSDRDSSKVAHHHTLGLDPNQASPGDHNHNGRNSKLLLDGVTISGSLSGGTALISVINALEALGATDNTVA